MALDRTDLSILAILGRDCRASYRSIGSRVGLTSKSVKARVRDMIQSGVIEKFVVRVNPAAFSYRTALVSARSAGGISRDEIIERVREFGDLVFHVHQMGRVSLPASSSTSHGMQVSSSCLQSA